MYVSSILSGTADLFWFHAVLIAGSVIAGITVGAGIIFEGHNYSERTYRIATWLVIVGVAVESFCTVVLFVGDEALSGTQQDKIIRLDTDLQKEREKTAARSLTKEQFDTIQSIKGIVTDVGVVPEKDCIECSNFAGEIEAALHAAGVQLYGLRDPSIEILRGTGINVLFPPGTYYFMKSPLMVALNRANLYAGGMFHPPEFSKIRTDIPVIFVGEKFPAPLTFPYYQPGEARWTIYWLDK